MCVVDERWRFKQKQISLDHRSDALAQYESDMAKFGEADPLTDVITVKSLVKDYPDLVEDFTFPNVPSELLKPENWKGLYCAPLKFKEAVHLCEARGVLSSVQHRSRDCDFHNSTCLFLGDNLV